MSGEMTCCLPDEHDFDDGIRSLHSLLVTLSMILAWSFFDRLLLLLCFPVFSSVDSLTVFFTACIDTGLHEREIESDDLLLWEKTVATRSVGLNDSLCEDEEETGRTDGLALPVFNDDDAGEDGLAFGMLRIISVN